MKNKNKQSFQRKVREFVFSKLIFPKILVIDSPGIIINEVSGILKGKNKKRLIYVFEEVISKLQEKSFEEFGEEKAKMLWYKIGKDFGVHYALISQLKVLPRSRIGDFLKFAGSILSKNGTSIASKVEFDESNFRIVLSGEDNIISRKSGDVSLFAGFFSGLVSFICSENIEAEGFFGKKVSKIVLDPKFETKYISLLEEVSPIKEYNKLNFPSKNIFEGKVITNKDLIRFRKFSFDESGKFSFQRNSLVTFDQSFFGFIVKNFLAEGEEKFLFESLEEIYFAFSKNIFSGESKNENLEIMKSVFSGLGHGVPVVKEEGKRITCRVYYIPIDKNTSKYYEKMILSYLQYISGKKLIAEKIIKNINPFSLKFVYRIL